MSFSIEDDLNEDCLLEIFSYLSIDDMIQVKRVCKKWYQVSQHWFKQVQALVYHDTRWELYEKHYMHEIYEGFETKKLMSILNSCGPHIKYFKMKITEKYENFMHADVEEYMNADPTNELGKFNWFPKLCENIVNAEIRVPLDFFTPSTYKIMAKHWKKLENLDIEQICSPFDKNFLKLLRNNQQLKSFSLNFSYSYFDNECDKIFTSLPPTIKKIKMKSPLIDDTKQLSDFRLACQTFTSLQSLELGIFRHYLYDATILAIANIKSLTHLSLPSALHYESQRTIESIANLKSLKSLNLSDNRDLIEDTLINIVESCIQLEHLVINDWESLTDKGMSAIAKLGRLKILHIYGENVSIKSILHLPDSLEVFVCSPLIMNDSDVIKFLKKATNLRFTYFSMLNLTKDALKITNEILNERKKNILCIYGDFYSGINDNIDTPYFKYCEHERDIPLEIFPEHIKNYLKEFYCL